MTPRDEATNTQVFAARPHASTWVSANAGSGKTRVLTDRVARLLLEKVRPERILCLTYTKAAASEMQNRLFKRLGQWAMLDDGTLRNQLVELGVESTFSTAELARARTLFASAIEAPGGLKIQTIHSFCSSLLRRFPLEAAVTPQFTEMDDRVAYLLRADIIRAMADGPQAHLVNALAMQLSDMDFTTLSTSVVMNRAAFPQTVDWPAIADAYGLDLNTTRSSIEAETFLGDEADIIAQLIPVLEQGSSNDVKDANRLRAIKALNYDALALLDPIFIVQSTGLPKVGKFPTKDTRGKIPDLMPRLDNFILRVHSAVEKSRTLDAATRTMTLHQFAIPFLAEYERRKQLRGLLDFDDLITKARNLLSDSRVAAWVLYKLDGGIDHILVDEAQDTSPTQWQVINALSQEFTAGDGARSDVPRTIFVVGDKKQSIYSFQGADPREFDRMQGEFETRLQNTNTPLNTIELKYSFRSSQSVLGLVDDVFANRASSGFAPDGGHIAFKDALPGRVDLWPLITKAQDPENKDWEDPKDLISEEHHSARLAKQIADEIRAMIDAQTLIPDDHDSALHLRPVRAGDFLILVQRRSDLFHEVIRACKVANLPIAGADQLKVGAELAVRDLAALLSFIATPEDDLSLAIALKSPLFGWSEQMLFDLAHRRTTKYLWEHLRGRRDDFPETMTSLDDLRHVADYLRPYDLVERILTRHNGRKNLLARLGQEAEDGINAFLAQALAFEQNAIPSLTGFLGWMETDDLKIKRQVDSASNQIRVMTVHGSKGLESPIVIMPDTAKRNPPKSDRLIATDKTVLWSNTADNQSNTEKAELETNKALTQAEQDRLLYVAMTRAEKWLIVAAAGDAGKVEDDSWYSKIAAAMARKGAKDHPFLGGPGLRLENGDWSGLPVKADPPNPPQTVPLPSIFLSSVEKPEPASKTLSPSDLGGAKALPGDSGLDEDAAKRRGRQIHRLLEYFPGIAPVSWPDMAARLLSQGPDAAKGAELEDLLAEAADVAANPGLAMLFDPAALAEVSISANLDALGGARVHGTIDRLLIRGTSILAVDFKTNATVPENPQMVPLGLLRQMGAYAHALAEIYPNHTIETALLWTKTAKLMPLPHDLVTMALHDTTSP